MYRTPTDNNICLEEKYKRRSGSTYIKDIRNDTNCATYMEEEVKRLIRNKRVCGELS